MKKKLIVLSVLLGFTCILTAQVVQPKTTKIKVEGRKNAYLYMTEIYKTNNWAEYYFKYEEDKNTYDEAETEKFLYEYFANYKREHGYSTIEVEDLKGSSFGEKLTSMEKRVVFRNVNKR
ncbi:hypothetical protein DWQ65_05955 [Treponema phagedenis]|uniref:Uncharacterized protein n=1 Tax=Treponema phagedenis TaxID=162 RepID=A0A0B7GV07_TREPH|nr:hypothetical protein [Treponema phagedenis]EFW38532.1 hypothetical protein HMPREF9554_00984 [Treponema phagedenis F0421]NVP24569.1 hypothetical protein [Treponema phagedenis]QEJ94734.1 hypothetical protein FUT79_05610 [Treponema phagedenis]QEJ97670.1 hypothetical protein FUT82_06465 [Treponema phagedenis]QEK00639.1 hypothetical protein FUT84_05300 [Treponema phagedenis]